MCVVLTAFYPKNYISLNVESCVRIATILPVLGYAAPGQSQWMQAPPAPTNCPPGLEYLTQIDQLLVKQQVELLEGEN